jgi:hypothetical protein
VAVAVSLVFFALAGVIHHHGLPGGAHRWPVLGGERQHRDAVSDSCVACRSSHEQVTLVAAPPSAGPSVLEIEPVAVPEAAPVVALGRNAGGSRAPPTVTPLSA